MVQRTPQVHRRKANRARSSGATPVKRYGLIAFFTTFLFVMTPPGIIVNLGDGLGTEVSWYLRYGAIAVALLCYIAKGCHKAFYVLALAYGILSFGTMFLGDAPLFWAIRVAFPCSAIVLLVGVFGRDRYEELLWGLLISMSVYSLLNALVLVFVPPTVPLIHESTSYTFLGNRNGFSRVYLPSIMASCLLDALQGKRFSLRSGVLTGAGIIQACLAFSATSAVELVFVLVGFFLVRNKAWRRWLNAGVFAIGYLVVFFVIVVLRLQFVFGPLIEGLLGRQLDFSGRVELWDQVMAAMDPSHLLFGYPKGGQAILWIGDVPFWTAHNGILDLLLWGGISSLLVCVAMIGIVCVKLWRARDSYAASLYSLLLGAFFIGALMESIMFPQFVFVLAMAYNVSTGGKANRPICQQAKTNMATRSLRCARFAATAGRRRLGAAG